LIVDRFDLTAMKEPAEPAGLFDDISEIGVGLGAGEVFGGDRDGIS
jgi:hypothetical protein